MRTGDQRVIGLKASSDRRRPAPTVAGQTVTTGDQARIFADHYIYAHIKSAVKRAGLEAGMTLEAVGEVAKLAGIGLFVMGLGLTAYGFLYKGRKTKAEA